MNETPNQEVIFDLDYLVLAAEAVLFANGSAIGFDKLAASLEVDEDKVPEILGALKKRYDKRETAIELIIMRDCAVLATKSRYRDIVRRALELRKNQPLSKAALRRAFSASFPYSPSSRIPAASLAFVRKGSALRLSPDFIRAFLIY